MRAEDLVGVYESGVFPSSKMTCSILYFNANGKGLMTDLIPPYKNVVVIDWHIDERGLPNICWYKHYRLDNGEIIEANDISVVFKKIKLFRVEGIDWLERAIWGYKFATSFKRDPLYSLGGRYAYRGYSLKEHYLYEQLRGIVERHSYLIDTVEAV